jgi:hypothetical protein
LVGTLRRVTDQGSVLIAAIAGRQRGAGRTGSKLSHEIDSANGGFWIPGRGTIIGSGVSACDYDWPRLLMPSIIFVSLSFVTDQCPNCGKKHVPAYKIGPAVSSASVLNCGFPKPPHTRNVGHASCVYSAIRDKRAAPRHEARKTKVPSVARRLHHRPADKLLTCPRGWVAEWTCRTRKPRLTENELTNDRTPERGGFGRLSGGGTAPRHH